MDDILRKLLDEINDAYDKTEGYIIYDLMKAVALVIAEYDTNLDEIEKLLDVDNLTGSLLETYVYQRKGIERNQATKAIGELSVSGNGTISQGDLFETASGIQFISSETKTISGAGTVKIEAVVAGSLGNVPASQIVQIPVTISGITGVTNNQPTHDGYEAESDSNLRERYYLAVRTPATSGNVNHYKGWAKSVSGVGDVKIFPLERGDNTVEIVIIDQSKQPASSSLVATVQNYIDPNSEGLGYGEAPIGAFCYVESATGLDADVSVSVVRELEYTNEEVQTNIENSIQTYLKSIAFTQSYVSYAAIGNAIFEAEGVADYSNLLINSTNTNVPIGDKEVAVLGAVTIA